MYLTRREALRGHDVALDLELARHEHALCVSLAVNHLLEVGIAEEEGAW